MPRKSRRRTRAPGGQTPPRSSASAGARQPERSVPAPVRQPLAGNPLKSGPNLNRQLGHLGSDIRRIFVCAGVCAVVLVVVYFLVR